MNAHKDASQFSQRDLTTGVERKCWRLADDEEQKSDVDFGQVANFQKTEIQYLEPIWLYKLDDKSDPLFEKRSDPVNNYHQSSKWYSQQCETFFQRCLRAFNTEDSPPAKTWNL